MPADYAGFWNRAAAAIVDGIITTVASLMLAGPLIAWLILTSGDLSADAFADTSEVVQGLANLASLVGGWLYYALMESSRFQGTLGKMAVGIQVTDMEGRRISFGRATGRYFGKIVSSLILFIGFLMVAFTEKKQGLHDLMAGCLVVKKQ